MRSRFLGALILAVAFHSVGRTQEVVSYRATGHLDPDDGAIEFWLRLNIDAVKPDGAEVIPYYPLFNFTRPGDPSPRVMFSYTRLSSPNHYSFQLNSYGSVNGKLVQNDSVGSLEDTVEVAKADRGGARYPRIPRLKAGEWHHIALTWTEGPLPLIKLYVDGKAASGSVRMKAPLFDDLREMRFNLLTFHYQDAHSLDELRLSSIARSPEEIQQSMQAGRAVADRHTLLIDRFEQLRQEGEKTWTTPEVHATGIELETGLICKRNSVELAEGKSGKGLKFLRWYK
ncbi:MAG: hypothetical protein HY360_27030 [Verrucomicrobia bacterium]|nr:hypothetical protein [Verrucomicrobiota bacterium]